MAIRFQIRGGSKAEWTSANPVLMERELGIELDTRQVKIGDGFNEWSNLPYMTQGDTGLTGKEGPKGEKGDPFVYNDFTEAQLLGLVGPQGPRGYQGDPFVYGDFTHEQLEALRGPTGTVDNLDEWNIFDTLGYFPVSPTELEKLEYAELSSTATNIDDDGIYKNIEWKRLDDTTYAKSELLGVSPYTQIKIDYYNDLGTNIEKTITWNLTYDENSFIYKKEVV